MWPRHTGDFSMFRVYMGPDGTPAEFNADNVPFKPRWHFPVSLNGVKEGDFAMVMGFRQHRPLPEQPRRGAGAGRGAAQPGEDPRREAGHLQKHMDADPATRIMYASKYASVSNYWKYFIGQQRGLKRLKVYDKKKAQEEELMAWIAKGRRPPGQVREFNTLLENGATPSAPSSRRPPPHAGGRLRQRDDPDGLPAPSGC